MASVQKCHGKVKNGKVSFFPIVLLPFLPALRDEIHIQMGMVLVDRLKG